jgi:hypothetical protein
VVRAIALTRLPVMRSLLDDVIALIQDIRQVFPPPAPRPSPVCRECSRPDRACAWAQPVAPKAL